MYKAIVVDDEPRVRRGLTQLIPKLDPEWTVAGEAKNGLEAIELVKKEMPDLVITDIRMPQMNGLDLLIALKEYPVHVVILSGYGYFEYAQTAVKFGAFDYLLKPLKPVDIEDVLRRVKEQKRDSGPMAEQQPNPLNFSKWWKDWLLEPEEGMDHREQLQRHMPLDASSYQILAIEIDRYDELITDDQWGDKQLVLFAVRNIVHEVMLKEKGVSFYQLFASGPQLICLAVNRECEQSDAQELIGEVRKWVKISITVGVSEATDDFKAIPAVYRQAVEALQNKWIYGDGIVCDFRELNTKSNEASGYPSEIDEAIVRAIRGGEPEKAQAGLSAFMDTIKGGQITFRLFRRFCLQLLSSVFRVVYEHKINDLIIRQVRQPQEFFHRNFTAEEYTRYLKELIDSTIASMEWSRQQRHNRTMEKAVEFIVRHYSKDISLDDVAAHVQMSSSYFSSYFKQEKGETFIEYLTRLRIDKAKSLMMNAEIRLYEIAQMVGYQDVKYFSRLFKRHAGVTPAEYRQFFYRKED